MLQARFSPLVDALTAVSTVVVVWFGAHAVRNGSLTLGLLLVFISYLKGLYRPMKQLSKLSYVISRGTASAERLTEILDQAPSLPVPAAPFRPDAVRGDIVFDNVTFRYPGGHEPVLADLSFAMRQGQTTALVGRTGAGKSTIVSLVPRLYDVEAGRVLVDGVDVREWDAADLRAGVSFVLQDTWLFQASVAEGASLQDIERVAREAQAHEFVEQLEHGYDTVVGPRGAKLSGGQRQRIAIARAILRDAPILILDEPTTGLDPRSEGLVLEALGRLMRGRTTLVIAHGEAPIIEADQILVVEDGRIARRGTFDALSRDQRRPWRSGGLAAIVGGR
jgi:ABC-type multidrug transport system fused ATPase/permease subunit